MKKQYKLQSEIKKYTEANRTAWNEVMPLHQKVAKKKWDRAFRQPKFVCLDRREIQLLNRVGVKGKNIVHICCNNGIELMSLKNLGANHCVGFDISDLAIQEAKERSKMSQIDCQFVRSDIYEIEKEYENRFDLAYISVGCFGWMPNLMQLFKKVASLLKKNGQIFIYELHPFSQMLACDEDKYIGNVQITESYFRSTPYVESGGLDYIGNALYKACTTNYWFTHTLSDIFMGIIENQISIEHFSEYEKDISAVHRQIEKSRTGIPLSYILIGRKQKKSNHSLKSGEK